MVISPILDSLYSPIVDHLNGKIGTDFTQHQTIGYHYYKFQPLTAPYCFPILKNWLNCTMTCN